MKTFYSSDSDKNWKVPFFTIWTGQALSMLGSSIAQFALIWWLTTETKSATVLATATLAGLLPGIIIGPFIGTFIDRWSRRIVMIVADSVMALGALLLAYLFFTGQLLAWHIYAVMGIRAIGNSFHWISMSASTTLMVPKEQITKIAGLNQTLNGVINIVAPPLGALFLEILVLHHIMLIDVFTAILATAPLYFIMIPQPEKKEEKINTSVISEFMEGMRYIFNWKSMVGLTVVIFIIKIALVPSFSLLPLLVANHYGKGALELSALEMLFGMGIILGGLLLSVWGGFKRKMKTMVLGLVLLGVGMGGLGLVPKHLFWLVYVFSGIMGLAVTFTDATFMSVLQTNIEPEIQGRTFSTIMSLLNISSPLGLIIAGPLSDLLGIQIWFIATGILCLSSTLVWLISPSLIDIEIKSQAEPHPISGNTQPGIAD
ncbi:MAG: MFS transporter [Anaerolineales bacterium]|nr:MFS transporter [Anaerolineales bacterium]